MSHVRASVYPQEGRKLLVFKLNTSKDPISPLTRYSKTIILPPQIMGYFVLVKIQIFCTWQNTENTHIKVNPPMHSYTTMRIQDLTVNHQASLYCKHSSVFGLFGLQQGRKSSILYNKDLALHNLATVPAYNQLMMSKIQCSICVARPQEQNCNWVRRIFSNYTPRQFTLIWRIQCNWALDTYNQNDTKA